MKRQRWAAGRRLEGGERQALRRERQAKVDEPRVEVVRRATLGLHPMRLPSSFHAALLVSALFACQKPTPPKIISAQPTSVTVDARGVSLGMELQLENDNGVDIPVQSVQTNVVLDTVTVGPASIAAPVTLAAHKTTPVPITVPLAWPDLGAVASAAAAGRDVKYTATGTVTLGGDLVNVTLPFQAMGTIAAKDLARGAVDLLPGLMPRP
jgi:LEA14-like dessication related protein